MDKSAVTVLVVDDEDDIRQLVRAVLEGAGLQVIDEAGDGLEALTTLENLNAPPVPTVIVLDNRMPGLTGLEVAEQVLQKIPDQRIVLFSAFLNDEITGRAQELGISACAAKSDVGRLPALIAGVIDDA
ncbi:MAG: two-component system, chemotaxis family, chemotaxis protein CheY [Acidimicrobiaceae bacterium]